MKKSLYLFMALAIICTLGSCTKKCVKCSAHDAAGVVVNESNTVCLNDLERNKFEDRYNESLKDFSPKCVDVAQ